MGENTTRNSNKSGGPSNQPGKSKGNGKTNSANSTTTQTTGNTTSGNTTRSNPTSDTTSSEKINPGLFVVEPPEPGTEPKQKKARPTGLTYNKGTKSKSPITSAAAGASTVIMVQAVIQSLFLVGSTRVGEHWAITDEEAEAIAVPAANIIAKYADTAAMEKYGDPAALLIALGVVVAPRVMITLTNKPKKEVRPNAGIKNGTGVQPSNQNPGGSSANSGTGHIEPARGAGEVVNSNVEQLLHAAVNSPY